MSDFEPVIHCPASHPNTEPHIEVKLKLSQTTLDGLNALLHWAEGFSALSERRVPGVWELQSLYNDIYQQVKRDDIPLEHKKPLLTNNGEKK